MRVFNKIVTVILILVALPLGTLFLVIPEDTAWALVDGFDFLAERLADLEQPSRMGFALLALALDLTLLWLLYLELRRKPTPGAKVTRVRGGEGELTLEAIRQRVHHHVSQLADVVEVNLDVSARGGRVALVLDVVTSPHVNVPKKIDEIVQVTREAVTGGMGLKLRRRPSVSIRHVAYSEASPPTAPSSSPSPPPSADKEAAAAPEREKKRRFKLPKLPGSS